MMDRIRENPRIYRPLRALRLWAGNMRGARQLNSIPGRVHFNDFMLASSGLEGASQYLKGGIRVVEILQSSLESCGKKMPALAACLEIGSGYGRVIRHVSRIMPASDVYACDVLEEAARFCSEEFGVQYFPRSFLGDAAYDNKFELIYLISVFSHLDSTSILALWSSIARMLRPGGVVVFTTQGKASAAQSRRYGRHWASREKAISDGLASRGYFYEKYGWYRENIGMTWVTGEFMMNLLEGSADTGKPMRFHAFNETALDGHQDVYIYEKLKVVEVGRDDKI